MRALVLASLVLGAAGCAGGGTATGSAAPAATGRPTTTTTVAPTTTTTVAPTTTTTDPGTLPQTSQLPTTDDPRFQSEMAALWQGVVTGSLTAAMPAFFPESAYVQLKAVASPQADFTGRLVGDFGLDLQAAHALLGPDPGAAQLDGVDATASFAHWVPPGVCYNRVGYYEMPNARVVYSLDGQVRSFGIASMISWRGVWYVVHLGAILRSSSTGVVDAPTVGPGSPAPSSTC